MSGYHNIGLIERSVFTSDEEVTGETRVLRNGGKESEMRRKRMIWHRPERRVGVGRLQWNVEGLWKGKVEISIVERKSGISIHQ